jgi:hypothetical protein
VFNEAFELSLAVFGRSHEEQVLQEVARLSLVTGKISIPYVHDQANGHVVRMGSLFEHDIEAVL